MLHQKEKSLTCDWHKTQDPIRKLDEEGTTLRDPRGKAGGRIAGQLLSCRPVKHKWKNDETQCKAEGLPPDPAIFGNRPKYQFAAKCGVEIARFFRRSI
jgi:hypothetical protein